MTSDEYGEREMVAGQPEIAHGPAHAALGPSSPRSYSSFVTRDSSLVRAPEFPAGAGPWLNGPPLTLRGLRGAVVLLDFWKSWSQYVPARPALPLHQR
jgi:hypothetical protein